MTAAYVSLVSGFIVTLAYLIVVWRGLIAAKREMTRYGGARIGEIKSVEEGIFRKQEKGIVWKSAAGVVLSTLALVLLILGPWSWYLVPFLAIGTAISVIVAFLVEQRSTSA
jgi:hypothetical protein